MPLLCFPYGGSRHPSAGSQKERSRRQLLRPTNFSLEFMPLLCACKSPARTNTRRAPVLPPPENQDASAPASILPESRPSAEERRTKSKYFRNAVITNGGGSMTAADVGGVSEFPKIDPANR